MPSQHARQGLGIGLIVLSCLSFSILDTSVKHAMTLAPAAKASGEAAPKAVKAAKAAAPKAKPAAKAKAKPAAKAPPPPPAPPPISARNQEVAVVPAAPAKPSVVRRRPGA